MDFGLLEICVGGTPTWVIDSGGRAAKRIGRRRIPRYRAGLQPDRLGAALIDGRKCAAAFRFHPI